MRATRAMLGAVLLGLICQPLLALNPELQLSQAVQQYWSRTDGLPLNSIYSVTQSPDGFLWLGTQAGLVRFDGTSFHIFRKGDDSGLDDSILTGVYCDPQGRLWVNSSKGLFRQSGPERFEKISLGDNPEQNQLLEAYMAADGSLWGNRPMGSFILRNGTVESLGNRYLLGLSSSPDKRRIIATFPNGMIEFTKDGERTLDQVGRNLPNLPMAVAFDRNNQLWLAAADGIWRLEGESFVRVEALQLDAVLQLVIDRAGNLWMSFRKGGGARYHPGRRQLEPLGGRISQTRITTFFEDRDGSMWLGTDDEGLCQLRDGLFTTLGQAEGLPYPTVNALAETAAGTLCVGTHQGGLYWQRGSTSGIYSTSQGLAHPEITSLREGPSGGLWIGFANGQVQELHHGKFKTYTSSDGLPQAPTTQLIFDAEGRLWSGHISGGLYRMENGRFINVPVDDGQEPLHMITASYRDSNQTLWFGSRSGLAKFENGKLQRVDMGVPDDLISCLLETRPGELWIGTQQSGLGRLRNGRFEPIPVQDLPQSVFALTSDNQNRLWIISNDGVSCITPENITAYEQGKATQVPRLHFNRNDGLRSLEGRGVVGPTVLRDHRGIIHFATEKGVASIDPVKIGRAHAPAKVRITAVTVDNQQQSIADGLALEPGWKSITIDYSALELTAPDRLKFQTQLQGYDPLWIETGGQRKATYTTLAPGTYTFRVRGRRDDGDGSTTETSISFVVLPAFYQTLWFGGIIFIGLTSTLFGLHRWRLRRTQKKNERLEQIIRERTEEIEQANHALAKANALKDRMMTVIGHDLLTPVTSIRMFCQSLANHPEPLTSEELQQISGDVDRMARAQIEVLEDILAWGRIQSGEWPVVRSVFKAAQPIEDTRSLLQLTAQGKCIDLIVEADLEAHVFADEVSIKTILRNLVANALKFTPVGGWVRISATQQGQRIIYQVEDNGQGMAAEAAGQSLHMRPTNKRGLGLGLPLCRALTEVNHGTIEIRSAPDRGTLITCTFPAA